MSVAEQWVGAEEEDPRQAVATEVRVLMARHRINQKQLAEAVGIKQPSLSRRLSGEIAFDIDELAAIARHFGVALSDLVARSRCFSLIAGDGPEVGQLSLPLHRPALTTV